MIAKGMIDVQQAAQQAINYCAGLFGNILRVRLEEVELTNDDAHWLITVGFDVPRPLDSMEEAVYGLEPLDGKRQYRVVNIDAQTGAVRSVKIRQPLERIS